ncbi:C-glycoside deglycosidase beta subunit domain-containing protein [Arthrobacter sp. MMS24-T111]
METALRDDALTAVPAGFELRLGLPWIRSMPLSSVAGLAVEVDSVPVAADRVSVGLGARRVPAEALRAEPGWWFIQDRLVLAVPQEISAGTHAVAVDFTLMVPYLQAPSGSALVLPFHVEARLAVRPAVVPGISRDVA